MITARQERLAQALDKDSTPRKWRDYKWQLRHAIRDIGTFERVLGVRFEPKRRRQLEATLLKFPLSVTPYYASLIDPSDLENDPVFRQSFPNPSELVMQKADMVDPLAEERDSPVPGLTHRYPDRVLLLVSNMCSMYCRHCTRKRRVGDRGTNPDQDSIRRAIDYIRATSSVRDVLLSGGDPFLLPDDRLDWILGELRAIDHVEVVRIGTRTPVVLPYRITHELVRMLKKHHPLWLNVHFNHPRELTASATEALTRLADAGIPLGNQSVLLADVNDCPRIMRALVHGLVKRRVRPYYLYQCDLSEGLTHFRTPIGKGIEIIESLRGHTSGFAVPTYVIDAPGGGGKIPVSPNYIVSWSTNKVILRNYEGVITTYREPDAYKPVLCDRNCDDCRLQLKLESADERNAVGIAKLLADFDETISLRPAPQEGASDASAPPIVRVNGGPVHGEADQYDPE